MQKLKDETSGRLHALQLDVTSERDIHTTFLYVNENLPDGAPGISSYLLKDYKPLMCNKLQSTSLYVISGLWALVHAAAWVTLGECEWVPPSVLKRSIDINFVGLARLTQVLKASQMSRGKENSMT